MPGERGIVVVAEDDAGLRLLCRTVLEVDGFEVREAASAAEVDAALEDGDVRVMLLDVHLGDDNGLEIAYRLRQERPDLAIVFFSGSARLYGGEAEKLGAAIITKPFSVEELSETVARVAR